jgi:hypothetical protein
MTDAQQQLVRAIKQQSLEAVKVALAAGADLNAYVEDRLMLGWHESAAGLLLEYEQPDWLDIGATPKHRHNGQVELLTTSYT